MRRLLSTGLAVFAGVVSVPITVSSPAAQTIPAPDYRHDSRLKALHRFFNESECPAVEYSHQFLEAADDYDLDWRLLPSISYVESTGGKAARRNNFFGWDSGRAEFSSPAAGIHVVGYRLAHSRLYKDKNLDELLATYNPDRDYARKVKFVMRRIAPTE
jgi:hypothetical protein